jgi:hypothetical protein
MPENERGHTRSHCMDNTLWKRLWTSCKTDYGMNICRSLIYIVHMQYICMCVCVCVILHCKKSKHMSMDNGNYCGISEFYLFILLFIAESQTMFRGTLVGKH